MQTKKVSTIRTLNLQALSIIRTLNLQNLAIRPSYNRVSHLNDAKDTT